MSVNLCARLASVHRSSPQLRIHVRWHAQPTRVKELASALAAYVLPEEPPHIAGQGRLR